ncbi:hypothetical protein BK004_00855 [bacterium CG10_46_32]|nr:MAG: hypothetical protein BK004_00855 [bacterium CG10_46_32]PIR56444.1 MAG: hypothetical protein COU73_00865 [Parcubacteria group bacterium CG10_big_fil_rev_8_21_14_0_10_46_32]
MPNDDVNQKNNIPSLGVSNLEQLMQENLELTREIAEQTRKTKKYILFGQIFNVVKIVLILGPIIVAIIYLPSLLKQWVGAYSELLGGGTGQTILEGNSFIHNLFGQNISK